MNWKLWRSPGPRSVPEKVWRAIETQFRLDVSQVGSVRYVEKRGVYAGRPVTYLRVFDPALVPDANNGIRSYDDLTDRYGAVLFEGHVERDGFVHLVDRRQPRAQASPRASAPAPSCVSRR